MADLKNSEAVAPSTGAYSSPLILVAKKEKGKYRVCVDFRRCNEKIESQIFPIPRITDIISSLNGAKIFSSIDMSNGFFQLAVKPE